MDAERFRQASYEVWEANAPGWERWRAELADSLTPVRQWLISALAPSSGDTVPELSAGTGDTGFAAARLLGPNGRLISKDFFPAMVQVARRRGDELRAENVEYGVVDAERIDLASDCVDGVLCQSAYMLMFRVTGTARASLASIRASAGAGGRTTRRKL